MTISFVGSGNVAIHMAHAFFNAGFNMLEICSRSQENAEYLAGQVHAVALTDVASMLTADVIVIAVKDDAIEQVVNELPDQPGLVVHTSGSIPLSVLSKFTKAGVLYPLQTFSKGKSVNFKDVPLCIEGNSEEALAEVRKMAANLSQHITGADSTQRKYLHLAAVFACNFTNHLYALSEKLLEANGLSFDLLRPLIAETAGKIEVGTPKDVQTGPAIRRDEKVLSTHAEMLKDDKDLQELYNILSKSIKKLHS